MIEYAQLDRDAVREGELSARGVKCIKDNIGFVEVCNSCLALIKLNRLGRAHRPPASSTRRVLLQAAIDTGQCSSTTALVLPIGVAGHLLAATACH